MNERKPTKGVQLVVPLDISGIDRTGTDQSVKVAARRADGSIVETIAKFNAQGEGKAILKFEQIPGSLQVAIGPADVLAETLFNLQTMTFNVPVRQWEDRPELVLQPIPIPAYFWFWWLRWCR